MKLFETTAENTTCGLKFSAENNVGSYVLKLRRIFATNAEAVSITHKWQMQVAYRLVKRHVIAFEHTYLEMVSGNNVASCCTSPCFYCLTVYYFQIIMQ